MLRHRNGSFDVRIVERTAQTDDNCVRRLPRQKTGSVERRITYLICHISDQ